MKILYVVTVGSTMVFFENLIKELMQNGHIVDIATNEIEGIPSIYQELGCKVFQIDCSRSPLDLGNITAVKQINQIAKKGQYDIVHCHTPIAAMCTRIACRPLRKNGLKVFYTAHGFHFYKGSPLKNWLIYYPVEKICSYYTDTMITINKEDYHLAKRKMKAKRILYVPGVGIDLNKFSGSVLSPEQKSSMRKKLGVFDDETMLLSVGEYSFRKNHEIVIRALAQMKDVSWKYYIAGCGSLQSNLEELISVLGLQEKVFLLGQRNDISELCGCADLFILPSFQEGLPVALMEAIASKIPVICSNIRGNTDLVEVDATFDPHSVESVKEKIDFAMHTSIDKNVQKRLANLQRFSLQNVNTMMREIYESAIKYEPK